MKVALYARVSSEKQAEKDLSIPAQLKALRKFAQDKGWTICGEYVDEAQSARSADRPAFQRMIAGAKQPNRPFEAIVVWKLNRFARNREDSIIYKSLLRRLGVSVESINERLDDSPASRLYEGMIEVIDEFYSINLGHDTLRGMTENATRGFRNGGTTPTGYRTRRTAGGQTTLEPDPVFAPVIKRLFRLASRGHGVKDIAKELARQGLRTRSGDPWTSTAVHYVLKNETYAGVAVWNRKKKNAGSARRNDAEEIVRVENSHTPLVSPATFATIQKRLADRNPLKEHPRSVTSRYLLSGLVRCGSCGMRMIGCAGKSSRYFYYGCGTALKQGKQACGAKQISRHILEEFLIDRLKVEILTDENLRELVDLTNEELKGENAAEEEKLLGLDGQLEDLRERLKKLFLAVETGKFEEDDLAPRIREIKGQIEGLASVRSQLSQTLNLPVDPVDEALIRPFVKDLKNVLGKGSIVEQKSFLRSFVKKVEVRTREIAIEYTIPLGKAGEPFVKEVLSLERDGSSGRI
jgi:site-specific DNA recombinase